MRSSEAKPRPKPQTKSPPTSRGLRIVGGVHRGRRLIAPAGEAVRPTSDRAREALFNILSHGRFAAEGLRTSDYLRAALKQPSLFYQAPDTIAAAASTAPATSPSCG